MWLAAVLGAVGTGLWAILIATSRSSGDDVRYALVGAGLLALLSMFAMPPCHKPTELSLALSFLLAAYQTMVYFAVSRGGAVMQAVINCNVVIVCLYRHFFVKAADYPPALFAATVSAASSAALLSVCQF